MIGSTTSVRLVRFGVDRVHTARSPRVTTSSRSRHTLRYHGSARSTNRPRNIPHDGDYMTRRMLMTLALLFLWALFSPVDRANAQTTSGLTGIVKDAQGAVVPGATITAVHEPSGTSYEGISQADGRFLIPGMRVGGPYTVTAALTGFRTETQNNIDLALGVVQDLSFTLSLAT